MAGGTNTVGLGRVFLGSEAVAAGRVTSRQLRGPQLRRLLQGVYAPANIPVTHELRCEAAALVLHPDGVITGRSAATLHGVALAWPEDPVEIVVAPERRIARRPQLQVRRAVVDATEWSPWGRAGLATPLRTTLDLLLDRPLPDAVADLDAMLRKKLVPLQPVQAMVAQRSDRGITVARRAVELADPRAESRPESRVRVHLVLAGLAPEPQYWIEDERGRLACVDLAFPAHRVAVEYDGNWRDGEQWALNRDRERLNRVQAMGWEIVFVTAALLRNPDRLVRTVRAALARRCA